MEYELKVTSDELYEIERWADRAAGETLRSMHDMVNALHKIDSDKVKEFNQNLFEKWSGAYDKYRLLSAKCERLRKNE